MGDNLVIDNDIIRIDPQSLSATPFMRTAGASDHLDFSVIGTNGKLWVFLVLKGEADQYDFETGQKSSTRFRSTASIRRRFSMARCGCQTAPA